jgi:cobalamin biosynthesis Mg chelatase CobN
VPEGDDAAALARKMPFPASVMDRIVRGDSEADVLIFKGDALIPQPGTPEGDAYSGAVREACLIRDLLRKNTQEIDSVVNALNGAYVPPAPGGDLLRDGSGVLPTGRNIHALDPYRMPSQVRLAWSRLGLP